jgi:hypothetical protein
MQPTTPSVPLFSYVVGFVAGFLAHIGFEVLVAHGITWSGWLAIFTGVLGAILAGFGAAFSKPVGPERKQLTDSLFAKLCIIVGVILGFWVPAVVTTGFIAPQLGEDAIFGLIYGLCAGLLITPLGALAGKYVARYLMNVRSEEDKSQ